MKPLSGIRIVEFDGLGPVTFAGMMLADLGADIVRLTRAASAGAAVFDQVGGEILHRGRAAVPVDLKDKADRVRILDLVSRSDAVIEGFRPGVMERLGLGPEALQAQNPRLVYGRVTGWGQSGPLASEVGHDINYLALSGALHALGDAERPPRPPLNMLGDYGGGAMMLVTGLLAALIEARTTGHGRIVDAAMTDGSALLTSLFHAFRPLGLWNDTPGTNLLDGGAPFYRCYRCRDGRFVAVGALEPRFYAALVEGLGLATEEVPQFPVTQWPALHGRFEAIFMTRDRDDWATHFSGTEACVTPVLTMAEAPLHPHNAARDTFSAGPPIQPSPAPRFGKAAIMPGPGTRKTLDAALSAWSVDRIGSSADAS
ncbi:CaiB/BaiF CoA transferase family protein [Brevundimonas variabilis]|uniref:Alpha-methylacyl-CoA racemase n=1 Tax=Brevundimonas variabilis TaxID=74312 RepID=A0A7W9FE27_9CAUL|nr:CaiB/BaiF CoA-transferase family protein [Brevundimonas variabilis]MBB5746036.1 alpha-methylacyl-CoA racemase [Brevundimonas variabilis]